MDKVDVERPDLCSSVNPSSIELIEIAVTWHGTELLMRIFRVPILIDQTLRVQWVLQLV
jgi:hypothetical protein